MELNDVLRRVRALIERAEHESTPTDEAQACREKADALMLKFAIDEAQFRDAMPAAQRATPDMMEVELASSGGDILGWIASLARDVAKYCRCKVNLYSRFDHDRGVYMAKVYGFKGDLAYFEVLYTTVRLHMLGILRPAYNPERSLQDNVYDIRNAGYNWLDIAQMQGWRLAKNLAYETGLKVPMKNRETGEVTSYMKVIGPIKRAYQDACKARGVRPRAFAPSATGTYRNSAAMGYVSRIHQRLQQAAHARQGGAEVILASSAQTLEDFFREDNSGGYKRCPRCGKLSSNPYECEFCGQFIQDKPAPCPKCAANPSGSCRAHPPGSAYRDRPFNSAAYYTGVNHADSADLGTSRSAGAGSTREIG